MASVTLAESAKLAQNELVAGVIENVITVNQMFELLPFDGIEGNALAYNRENALGDVQLAGVDDNITANNPATFTPKTSSLTTIIGDAEVNGLIQVTRSSDGNDQTAIQIASKSKSCGRQYQDLFINGDANVTNEFDGLIELCAAGQTLDATLDGGVELSFDLMDEVIDLVTDKDGAVDYLAMSGRTRRLYRGLLRAQPGAGLNETMELPSGKTVATYGGIPVFRNDWIPNDVNSGTTTNTSYLFAGTFDDGSRTHGIAGLTASQLAGMQVEDVGIMEAKDNHKWRVKWYAGLALFSEKGLAMATGIKSTITVN